MAANPYLVTPAGGANQVVYTYGGTAGGPPSTVTLTRGTVIDATAGMVTAIGAGNLTALSGTALLNEQIGEHAVSRS